MRNAPPPLERFWSNVNRSNDSACWLWLGKPMKDGYGRLKVGDIYVRAHRYAWNIANGDIPTGLMVCHRCDVPLCCNPAHLFLGTNLDNMADMKAKGRSKGRGFSKGNLFANKKMPNNRALDDESVRRIRALHRPGVIGYMTLGKQFGLVPSAIQNIIKGRSYRDVF